jgi:endonuclease III
MKPMKTKVDIIRATLKRLSPTVTIALNYSNPLELLFSVMLAAQCTDKKVNEVTEKLFKKYPTLDSYVNADQTEFEQDIRSTGFYRAKAKNVLTTAKLIKADFGGQVPQTMAELITLPGVARKTANVVLSEAFGKHEGIAVDTHVTRLANKFGLTTNQDPVKIEQDLMKIVPQDEWRWFSLSLVQYGRDYSPAHKKNSIEDPISQALQAENLL